MSEIRNESVYEFKKIIGEVRCYHFPGDEKYIIFQPRYLNVSKSGDHRIVDSADNGHYVRSGWLAISWTVAPDEPHFTI